MWLRKEQSTLTESIKQLEQQNQILLKRAEDAESKAAKQGKKEKVTFSSIPRLLIIRSSQNMCISR